jgi:molybdopterin synthase sulfur carrier subunit
MSTKIKILYFASLGERLGCDEEWLNNDGTLATVADLKTHLAARGGKWTRLQDDDALRCAVNQSISDDTGSLANATEVAFFPPVTGG